VKRCSSLHSSHKAQVDKMCGEQEAANAQLEQQFAAVSTLIVQDATRAALDEHLPQALQLLDQVCSAPRSHEPLLWLVMFLCDSLTECSFCFAALGRLQELHFALQRRVLGLCHRRR
jgi:hypothetical protein